MRYLLLVYGTPGGWCLGDRAFADLLRSGGRRIDLATVQSEDGTLTEVRGEIVSVAPRESIPAARRLSGAWLVEARDLNEAIRLAQRIPSGRAGTVEVHRVSAPESLATLAPLRPSRHP